MSRLIDIEKKLKNLRIKTKHRHVFFRKVKKEKIGGSDKEISDEMIKPQGTFTLKIDDEGNLVGFPIKKVKSKEKKKKHLLAFGKEKSEGEKTEEITGFKGKIKNIFSRGKSESSGEGGSKISNVVGKIKGIFSRKTKE